MKSQFPIAKEKINGHPIIYLDSAATSLTPLCVQEAMMEYYNKYNANVHRSTSGLAMKATEKLEESRETIAKFIGANTKEIIFTRNATEGLNIVARLLAERLHEEEEIVLSIAEHHSNLVVWQQIAHRKRAVLKFIDVKEDGSLDLEHAKKLIGAKTKIVTITHASNVLGVINPIKELSRIAHENCALLVVDAAQTVGHIPVDVKELEADFLAFSGHKMCGPTGIGVLYGDEELLEALPPYLYGGEMIEQVTKEESTWNNLPWKYEAGTPNIAGAIGLARAIDFIQERGLYNIQKHVTDLTKRLISELKTISGVKIFGDTEKERTGVISFTVDKTHSLDMASLLDAKGIQLREGSHCAQPLMVKLGTSHVLRVSLYLYNSEEDIDFFIKSLKQTIITLGGNK